MAFLWIIITEFDKARNSTEAVDWHKEAVVCLFTSTLKISDCIHALSCIMSLIEIPIEAMCRQSSAMPPGRSLTVTENLKRRPSQANPLSRHRPRTVVSMLPPHSGRTTLTDKHRIRTKSPLVLQPSTILPKQHNITKLLTGGCIFSSRLSHWNINITIKWQIEELKQIITQFNVVRKSTGKSLARPTSRCVLFDSANSSFDASIVIYRVFHDFRA
jgi:hypothetical protein